jgi:hypothetical protein
VQLQGKLPPGITLIQADDLREWLLDIQVMDENPIYAGETYRLKFMFSENYPIEVCSNCVLPNIQHQLIQSSPRRLKLSSSNPPTRRDPSRSTPTSTPTASSVSISSIARAGHLFIMWKVCASLCRACLRATRRRRGHRETTSLSSTTNNGRGTSAFSFMTTRCKRRDE